MFLKRKWDALNWWRAPSWPSSSDGVETVSSLLKCCCGWSWLWMWTGREWQIAREVQTRITIAASTGRLDISDCGTYVLLIFEILDKIKWGVWAKIEALFRTGMCTSSQILHKSIRKQLGIIFLCCRKSVVVLWSGLPFQTSRGIFLNNSSPPLRSPFRWAFCAGLKELPPEVFQLKDLVDLSCSGNQISDLPDEFERLCNVC